jgi:hypothetical protein
VHGGAAHVIGIPYSNYRDVWDICKDDWIFGLRGLCRENGGENEEYEDEGADGFV